MARRLIVDTGVLVTTERGRPDLRDIVAATALITGRAVLTTDRSARFAELPDVECILAG